MNSAELQARIDLLQRQKDEIYAQVTQAKRLAAAEGIYADHAWLTSAEVAMKIKGNQIGKLQRKLGELKKAERASAHASKEASFERAFLHAARDILPVETYQTLLRMAAMEKDHERPEAW